MGGAGGVVIVRESIVQGLTDPTVHGQFPPWLCSMVDPVIAKPVGMWTEADSLIALGAVNWCLHHCT